MPVWNKRTSVKALPLLIGLFVLSIAWEAFMQRDLDGRIMPTYHLSLNSTSNSFYFDALLWTLEQRALMKEKVSLLSLIINPFSPILLCDHHYGVNDMPRFSSPALRPLDHNNVRNIGHLDMVCCQTDALESFVNDIVPLLQNKIILFTHKWNTPAVTRSNWTESVRQNPMVAHWFSQNPIYVSDVTYSAFPYGIEEVSLEAYAAALLTHSEKQQRTIMVQHLHAGISNPERNLLPTRPKIPYNQYYGNVSRSNFLLSPPGDRPDCFRHWEAIGLGTVPISSINESLYAPLFGRNMIFVPTVADMLPLLNSTSATGDLVYEKPSRHLIFSAYWASRVNEMKRRLMAADAPGAKGYEG